MTLVIAGKVPKFQEPFSMLARSHESRVCDGVDDPPGEGFWPAYSWILIIDTISPLLP